MPICLSFYSFYFFFREKRENRGDLRRDGRRIRALSKNENADFATGLIIGKNTNLITINEVLKAF